MGYKSRDNLMVESRKSILYSLILKTAIYMFSQMTDAKALRISEASLEDLKKERSSIEEGALDRFKESTFKTLETFARVRNVQNFFKNFLNSIMMQVLHLKAGNNSFLTKQ
jgi:hypothetical protein